MDKRRLVLAGIVAASMAVGGVLGAVAFTPRVGEASTGSSSDDAEEPSVNCVGFFGPHGFGVRPLEVAAGTIGIEVSDLLEAVREGDTIAQVAEDNDVDPADVIAAIVAAERERVDGAVADGVLTQEQADRLLASAEERAAALVNGEHPPRPLPGRFGPGWAHARGPGEGPIVAVLEELGIDLPELLDELREGRTIAEVAEELGVDLDAVIGAVVDTFREHLARAVEAGWMSEEEADELAADLRERAEAIVNGDWGPFPSPGRIADLGHRLGRVEMAGPGGGWWWTEEAATEGF